MKFYLSKILVVGLVVLAVLPSAVAYAGFPEEEVANLKKELSEQVGSLPVGLCRDSLVPLYDVEVLEFLQFLETNFSNKSGNSSLADIGIARYGEYKRALLGHFNKLDSKFTQTNAPSNQDELAAYSVCSAVTNSYINLGKKLMIEHIKNTSASKQATVLLEKYQAINDRLKELNLEVAKMYGLLATFKQKLPGFVKQCLTN